MQTWRFPGSEIQVLEKAIQDFRGAGLTNKDGPLEKAEMLLIRLMVSQGGTKYPVTGTWLGVGGGGGLINKDGPLEKAEMLLFGFMVSTTLLWHIWTI